MIVVIQCAGGKRPDAGCMRDGTGQPVRFVARPDASPKDGHLYARPDDLSDTGVSWRNLLIEYNNHPAENPYGLYPAYRLYANKAYERLVEKFGLENVFILSAGWGLIAAGFLTPLYDITFSGSAPPYTIRGKRENYADLLMAPEDAGDIVFLGGKDYLPLFCKLTGALHANRIVFYNSSRAPEAPGCRLELFKTRTRTNWHYECANSLVSEKLDIPRPQRG